MEGCVVSACDWNSSGSGGSLTVQVDSDGRREAKFVSVKKASHQFRLMSAKEANFSTDRRREYAMTTGITKTSSGNR